jgi:triosephosphate isomerase
MRSPVFAANWKMHHGPTAAAAFMRTFLARHEPSTDRRVMFFPPALTLHAVLEAVRDRPDILAGVQNIHTEEKGAFTGESSAAIAHDAGARLVLVGHSERRHVFGEDDETVNRKVRAVLAHGMRPILCVGETDEEREQGRAEEVVARHVERGLVGVGRDQADVVVIAYEPVWAIGTGKTATPSDANDMCGFTRSQVTDVLGDDAGATVRVQYGGSVKPGNVAELMARPEIDGALVGGASLQADDFAAICRYHRLQRSAGGYRQRS